MAGDGSHEVAILDGGGVVRIYDTRMGGLHHPTKGQHTHSDRPLHAFYAHESSGVGISRLPLTNEGRRGWLTWGFDSYDADGAVKVWREGLARVVLDDRGFPWAVLDGEGALRGIKNHRYPVKASNRSHCYLNRAGNSEPLSL